jgi:hypothetical protein
MSEENKVLDRIERYSKGKMSLDETMAFEKELASDEALQKQLELSQIVDQIVVGAEALKLKDQMRKDLYQPKSGMRSYLAVSLLVVSAGVGSYFMLRQKEDTPNVLKQKEALSPSSSKVEKAEGIPSPNPSSMQSIPQENKAIGKTASIAPGSKTEGTTLVPTQEVTKPSEMASNTAAMPNVHAAESATAPVAPLSSATKTSASNPAIKQSLALDPCASLTGEVDFYTVPTCKGEETGEVHIKVETVKGGRAPFTFVLGEKSSQAHFEHLASGQYSLFIKDGNNCLAEHSKKVEVTEKSCRKNKEYVFNPEYDLAWSIPYDRSREATSLKIMEKSGKIYFQSTVSAYLPAEWKGESNTGLVLGLGLYFFTIEYSNGSVDEGTIVVTR